MKKLLATLLALGVLCACAGVPLVIGIVGGLNTTSWLLIIGFLAMAGFAVMLPFAMQAGYLKYRDDEDGGFEMTDKLKHQLAQFGFNRRKFTMKLDRQQRVLAVMILFVLGIIVLSVINRVVTPTCGVEGLPACPPTPTPIPPALVIDIASSNTKEDWLNAVIARFNAESHTIASGERILVNAVHGTSGGTQTNILNGTLQPTVWSPGDVSWVDSANQTWRDRTGRLLVTEECTPTILAPIGLAMWRPMAEALGWPDTPISWRDLLVLMNDPQGWASIGHPEWGNFRFGHTHPAYSNVGMLAMTSLAYLATHQTEGLTADEVYSAEVADAFRAVELNTYHYGIQSRDLLRLMVNRGPEYLHAVTTSEAEMLRTNRDFADQLRFPLAFVFPSDGVFWGEHPYCVLDGDWVTDEQKSAAAVFLDYLLDPAQQALAIDNFLRPLDETVPLHAPLALENGTNPGVTTATVPSLEAPSSEATQAVIDVFYQTKKKATVVLVIDTSGSMNGDPLVQAVAGAVNFIERLDPNDELYIVGFGTTPYPIGEGGTVSQVSETLTSMLNGVYADGNTALFDAVCAASALIEAERQEHEASGDPHLYGIVLLSDGDDTASANTENQMFNCLPAGEDLDGFRVFTIAYGAGGNTDLMTRIANRTGGTFNLGTPENIDRIYTSISAEQ